MRRRSTASILNIGCETVNGWNGRPRPAIFGQEIEQSFAPGPDAPRKELGRTIEESGQTLHVDPRFEEGPANPAGEDQRDLALAVLLVAAHPAGKLGPRMPNPISASRVGSPHDAKCATTRSASAGGHRAEFRRKSEGERRCRVPPLRHGGQRPARPQPSIAWPKL